MPEHVDGRAACNQEPGHVPTAVPDGVVERSPDRSARGVEACTALDQGDGHVHIVAAGGPVQGCLRLSAAGVVVRIRARHEQDADRGRRGGEVAGPVGRGMEQCPPSTFRPVTADHAGRGELRSLRQESTQDRQVAPVDHVRELVGERIAVGQHQLSGLAKIRTRHRREGYVDPTNPDDGARDAGWSPTRRREIVGLVMRSSGRARVEERSFQALFLLHRSRHPRLDHSFSLVAQGSRVA